jgi:hypothetical protein
MHTGLREVDFTKIDCLHLKFFALQFKKKKEGTTQEEKGGSKPVQHTLIRAAVEDNSPVAESFRGLKTHTFSYI